MKRLPIEQVRALVAWENFHGRFWKTRLRQAWVSGDYGHFHMTDTAAGLQALRNEAGMAINSQISIDDLRAQLHHHDLAAAARVLIKQICPGGFPAREYHAREEATTLIGLLQESPENYKGVFYAGVTGQNPPIKG